MQTSFWEQDAMLDADFVVVGGGLIGLQTALELRERHPHAKIVVLERGALPAGASSRNAGFACFGSLTEIQHDCDTLGEDAVLAIVEQRWRGLQRLRQRLGDDAIGYEALGNSELLTAPNLQALDRLDDTNRLLRPLFGKDVFSLDNAALGSAGFGPQAKALLHNPFEGQLHSGRLMRSLAVLAGQCGIEVHGGTTVQTLEEGSGAIRIRLADKRRLTLRAARVAVCTNGFTGKLLPDAGIVPARGQVILTEPVQDLPWRGAYHMERGFYYFRNVGQRVLVGGGRHLDMAAEATSDMALTETIQNALEHLLRETILPGCKKVHIEQRWAGVMGFTADRKPLVRAVSDRVVIGFGCNGMGVALGADIAARTAALMTG